ncbi:helix-turn-helix transcriptional regulator [Patulibacter minatonensis]|uniref:helix-turn-helix transcriptional regulator n=1 Tax=Patulibacter minatonensis TaxID=298163 RepID=UPI000A01F4B1|nr:WYL domain-containing protein [Patulibacter minatonensis]
MPTTTSRLLSLLSLLQTRRDWPGAVLADRMEVSPRTVRRDVDRLREMGYRIAATKGPDGGYRLEAGSELPPLLFDDEQAIAIAVALQLATAAGAGVEETALRALGTVRQVMPDRLRRRIDALEITAVSAPDAHPAPAVDPAVLSRIGSAVHAREVLRFDYDAPGDGTTAVPPGAVRRAEPHHLVTWGGRWYLVAWDLDREAWRTFRVDRTRPREHPGPRFARREVPGGDVSTFVAGRFRGATDGTADWPCRGEVVLGLPADEVRTYAREGVVEALGPDRCRLTLGAWSWEGLAATIGRYDAEIEVIGPPALAEAFAVLGERYARAGRGAGRRVGPRQEPDRRDRPSSTLTRARARVAATGSIVDPQDILDARDADRR